MDKIRLEILKALHSKTDKERMMLLQELGAYINTQIQMLAAKMNQEHIHREK